MQALSMCPPPCIAAVAAVYDGFLLQKSVTKMPVGGQLLSTLMQRVSALRGVSHIPHPHTAATPPLHTHTHTHTPTRCLLLPTFQALEGKGTRLLPRYKMRREQQPSGEYKVRP